MKTGKKNKPVSAGRGSAAKGDEPLRKAEAPRTRAGRRDEAEPAKTSSGKRGGSPAAGSPRSAVRSGSSPSGKKTARSSPKKSGGRKPAARSAKKAPPPRPRAPAARGAAGPGPRRPPPKKPRPATPARTASGPARAAARTSAGKAAAGPKKRSVPAKPAEKHPLRQDIARVLVTGAAGGVGSALVRALLREKLAVTAVDRQIQAPARASRSRDIRQGDLLDPDFLAACMEGVDAVLHTAGHAASRPSAQAHRRLTVDETRALYSAAQKRGVKRLLFISSASIYRRSLSPVTEQDELDPASEFEQHNIEGERMVLWSASPGLPLVTVLRPGTIYGPGCRDGMASIATLPPLVRSLGPHYLPFSGGPKLSLVHTEDVARAAVFLLLHPRALGEAFNLADAQPMPFGSLVNIAMECYGLQPLAPGTPYPPGTLLQSILPYMENEEIFSPLNRVGTLLWERMGRKNKLRTPLVPRIDPAVLSPASRDLLLDSGKLLGLGFRLKHPSFENGWKKTVAWYVDRSWVPRPGAV